MGGAGRSIRKVLAKVASDHLPVVVDFHLIPQ
jgi:endonuclease/exonuclease/phosphatase (EEP) superfamily protein YafD